VVGKCARLKKKIIFHSRTPLRLRYGVVLINSRLVSGSMMAFEAILQANNHHGFLMTAVANLKVYMPAVASPSLGLRSPVGPQSTGWPGRQSNINGPIAANDV